MKKRMVGRMSNGRTANSITNCVLSTNAMAVVANPRVHH